MDDEPYEPEPEPCFWCGRTSCNSGSKCRLRGREHQGPLKFCPYCDNGVIAYDSRTGTHTCHRHHQFTVYDYDAALRSRHERD